MAVATVDFLGIIIIVLLSFCMVFSCSNIIVVVFFITSFLGMGNVSSTSPSSSTRSTTAPTSAGNISSSSPATMSTSAPPSSKIIVLRGNKIRFVFVFSIPSSSRHALLLLWVSSGAPASSSTIHPSSAPSVSSSVEWVSPPASSCTTGSVSPANSSSHTSGIDSASSSYHVEMSSGKIASPAASGSAICPWSGSGYRSVSPSPATTGTNAPTTIIHDVLIMKLLLPQSIKCHAVQ
mmetsp:Transcript_31875/g.65028  ORF Transcript_31875/g.65028 Transcript_31875/m.65028 type:complete len:236 (-) Transcript_31875:98-805(-)